MEMQAEAERRKRALILDSQGEEEAEVNLARGKKAAAVLASEAAMQELINRGIGEASAIEAHAAASANAVRMLAEAMRERGGAEACSLRVAEQYVAAFKALSASGNTVVVPANTGDVSAMVSTAMAIYRNGAFAPPPGGEVPAADVDVASELRLSDAAGQSSSAAVPGGGGSVRDGEAGA